jgi:hypothetical protein
MMLPCPQTSPPAAIAAALMLVVAAPSWMIPERVMAVECPLSAPLVVKETQAGVAGETGTVWAIAPDCSYTVARQFGSKLLAPHKHGQLTAEQQSQLGKLLAKIGSADFSDLAAVPPQVNPRRISLSYGARQLAVTLPPGGGPAAAARDHSAVDRAQPMLELSAAMKAMLGH